MLKHNHFQRISHSHFRIYFRSGMLLPAVILFCVVSCISTTPPVPAFTVVPSTPELGLSKKEVVHAIKPNLKPIQECYEKTLESYRSLTGKKFFEIKISGTGYVQEATVIRDEMTISVEDFEKCLANVINSIKFPPPRGGVTVTVQYYPLIFKPRKQTALPF